MSVLLAVAIVGSADAQTPPSPSPADGRRQGRGRSRSGPRNRLRRRQGEQDDHAQGPARSHDHASTCRTRPSSRRSRSAIRSSERYIEAVAIQLHPAGSTTPSATVTESRVGSKPGDNPAGVDSPRDHPHRQDREDRHQGAAGDARRPEGRPGDDQGEGPQESRRASRSAISSRSRICRRWSSPSTSPSPKSRIRAMKIKAANGLARILKAEGIPWVSCYPTNHVNNALGEEGVPILMMGEERFAVAVADGFSRVTERQADRRLHGHGQPQRRRHPDGVRRDRPGVGGLLPAAGDRGGRGPGRQPSHALRHGRGLSSRSPSGWARSIAPT